MDYQKEEGVATPGAQQAGNGKGFSAPAKVVTAAHNPTLAPNRVIDKQFDYTVSIEPALADASMLLGAIGASAYITKVLAFGIAPITGTDAQIDGTNGTDSVSDLGEFVTGRSYGVKYLKWESNDGTSEKLNFLKVGANVGKDTCQYPIKFSKRRGKVQDLFVYEVFPEGGHEYVAVLSGFEGIYVEAKLGDIVTISMDLCPINE